MIPTYNNDDKISMALRKYNKGEHPAGFIGYRVTQTFGWNHLRVERYFSAKQLTWEVADKKAHQVADELAAVSRKISTEDRIYRKKLGAGPQVLAIGLRAHITYSTKRGRRNYSCTFIVDSREDDIHAKSFNVSGGDIAGAYGKAVNYYCKQYGISPDDKQVLLTRQPSANLFNNYLVAHLNALGVPITVEQIASKVGSEADSKGSPSYGQYKAAGQRIVEAQQPLHLFEDKVLAFYRSSLDTYLYKEYRYDECGGINKAVDLALAMVEQYKTSFERKLRSENEAAPNPAECLSLYKINESRQQYAVRVPGHKPKSFNFKVSSECADGQLHAYRSALHYAASLLEFGEVDALAVKSWRTKRIYEDGHPALPGNFWTRGAAAVEFDQATLIEAIQAKMKAHNLTVEDLI